MFKFTQSLFTMVFATSNVLGNAEKSTLQIIKQIQPFAYVLVAIALIVNGIMMVVGGNEGREKAKKSIPWVALGCGIILAAVEIAKWFAGNFSF